jgi:hypothetical protein
MSDIGPADPIWFIIFAGKGALAGMWLSAGARLWLRNSLLASIISVTSYVLALVLVSLTVFSVYVGLSPVVGIVFTCSCIATSLVLRRMYARAGRPT